jgi:glutamate-1-semialdehyde aminotransferase
MCANNDPTAYGLDSAQHTNVNPTTKKLLRYGHIEDMEVCLEEHHARVGAIIMECIRNTGKYVPIPSLFLRGGSLILYHLQHIRRRSLIRPWRL